MLKQEFEALIGKRVDYDTFQTYETMYMATDLDKATFCSLLNVEAIPEAKDAIKAREALKAITDEITANINECKREVIQAKSREAEYANWAEISNTVDERKYWLNARKCTHAYRVNKIKEQHQYEAQLKLFG